MGRRPDGYHELSTIMQSVDISDTVSIHRDSVISVDCSDPTLCGSDNLAYRAAALFFEAAGISEGAKIEIQKQIPKAAGLAGGSADAAAVIVGLNVLYETGYDLNKLCEIGVKAGADVPFCIVGGTLLARGIGEKLSEVPPLPDCCIVVVKKGEKASTGSLYAQFDEHGARKRPDNVAMLKALEAKDIKEIGRCLCNVFEELVPESYATKQLMLEYGAVGSALSGSGPSVFGIFEDIEKAKNCHKNFDQFSKICSPARSGCDIIKVV